METKSKPPSFFRRKIVSPILEQLNRGVTPRKVALSVALGVTLGVFPIIGASIVVCAAAGYLLRLNMPIVILVSFIVYPLQIPLVLVFIKLGVPLFGADPLPLTPAELKARLLSEPLSLFKDFGESILYAVLAWAVIVPVATAILYFLFLPLIRRLPLAAESKEA